MQIYTIFVSQIKWKIITQLYNFLWYLYTLLWEPIPANNLTQAKHPIPALHEMSESQNKWVSGAESPKAEVPVILLFMC